MIQYQNLAKIETEKAGTEYEQCKLIQKELNSRRYSHRLFLSTQASMFAYGEVLVIVLALFNAIFSQSLLSFGYMLFAMLLIYDSRFFLTRAESANAFYKTLTYVVPYLLIQMLITVLC